MATEIWVNIGSGNGLLPDGTKPLPEPMLTDHQWSPATFIVGQFHKSCQWGGISMNCCISMLKSYRNYKYEFMFPEINWSPPSDAYMHQRIGSALVKIMACRLFGAKPLTEPKLPYCQLDSWEQFSVKFESEFSHFHSRKCTWKYRLPKWWPFCSGGDELIQHNMGLHIKWLTYTSGK